MLTLRSPAKEDLEKWKYCSSGTPETSQPEGPMSALMFTLVCFIDFCVLAVDDGEKRNDRKRND